MPKISDPEGFISSVKSRGHLFRINIEGKTRSIGGWRKTKKEALEVKKNFLKKRKAIGSGRFDKYSAELVHSATEAYELLLQAGVSDSRHIVDAVSLYLQQSPAGKNKMTFKEAFDQLQVCDRFVNKIKHNQRTTYVRFASYLAEDLPKGWDTPLNEITTEMILATRKRLVKDVSEDVGFRFQNHAQWIFERFFKKELRIINATPFDNIPSNPKPKQSEKKELYTPEESFKLFAHATIKEHEKPWRSLGMFIKAYTGMHNEELAEVTFDMFGKSGEMRFEERDAMEINIPSEHMKSGVSHAYPIPDVLKGLLFSSQWFMKHFEPVEPTSKSKEMFKNLEWGKSSYSLSELIEGIKVKKKYRGRKVWGYSGKKLSDWMKVWCEECGIEWRGNQFRHMVASYSFRALYDHNINLVQEAIGHSSGTETTIKHYKSKTTDKASNDYYNPKSFSKSFMNFWRKLEGFEVHRPDRNEYGTVKLVTIEGKRKFVNRGMGFTAKLNENPAGEKRDKTKSEEKLFGMG